MQQECLCLGFLAQQLPGTTWQWPAMRQPRHRTRWGHSGCRLRFPVMRGQHGSNISDIYRNQKPCQRLHIRWPDEKPLWPAGCGGWGSGDQLLNGDCVCWWPGEHHADSQGGDRHHGPHFLLPDHGPHALCVLEMFPSRHQAVEAVLQPASVASRSRSRPCSRWLLRLHPSTTLTTNPTISRGHLSSSTSTALARASSRHLESVRCDIPPMPFLKVSGFKVWMDKEHTLTWHLILLLSGGS